MHRADPVGQISANVRYVLWLKRVPRAQWVAWLSIRTSLAQTKIRALIRSEISDAQVSPEDLSELGRALETEGEGENLRFADLARDGSDVLHENLRFLFGSLGHGGKKSLASELGVDQTTVSRWLNGSYEPQTSSLRQISSYFGLPVGTDLREDLIFLSADPVALTERRNWLRARIDDLSTDELRELYPALRRMLEER